MWDAVHGLARTLPATDWVLVGGLMVQLHAFRYNAGPVRATSDIDLLANSRARPSATERTADILLRDGFRPQEPVGVFEPLLVYRFVRDDVVVDVMGPDGLREGRGPVAAPPHETFAVPGGTQALKRAEVVEVLVPGKEPVRIPCPRLAGSLILKARSAMAPTRAKDREDLAVLLACVDDPFEMRDELDRNDIRKLRAARSVLPQDEPAFMRLVGQSRGRLAYQTLTLLCSP
jgi:hypothetical protein